MTRLILRDADGLRFLNRSNKRNPDLPIADQWVFSLNRKRIKINNGKGTDRSGMKVLFLIQRVIHERPAAGKKDNNSEPLDTPSRVHSRPCFDIPGLYVLSEVPI